MVEIWKDIEGLEGQYQVSNLGNVRSLDRYAVYARHNRNDLKFIKGKILKPSTDKWGYKEVVLCKNSKHTHYKIHRLVATAFIPNPLDLPEIDHIDGDRTNNKSTNLKWADRRGNMANPVTRERIHEVSAYLYKPVYAYTKDGQFIEKFNSRREASLCLGCPQGHIGDVCNGKRKTTGGYIFRNYL